MAGIKDKCPVCGKVAARSGVLNFKTPAGEALQIIKYECGHSVSRKGFKTKAELLDEWQSIDGRAPRPFQKEGILRIEASNGNHGLFDQMGLGKTIQSYGFVWLHKEEVMPVLIVCKSGLKTQLTHEWYRWVGPQYLVQTIESTIEKCWPGFNAYVISFDILNHFKKKYTPKNAVAGDGHESKWREHLFGDMKFRCIIIDEVQKIKNSDSSRTQLVREIVRFHADEPRRVIALSGTPWENNFGEAFNVMNLLEPDEFTQETAFINEWCDTYVSQSGALKVGGLNPYKKDEWDAKTKHLITRRLRSEVGEQLPPINRMWHYIDIDDTHKRAYAEGMLELLDYVEEHEDDKSFETYSNILAMLSRLRHIAGLSKVKPCVEWVEDFLLSTDEKLVIFTHHLDVAQAIIAQLDKTLKMGGWKPPIHFKAGADMFDLTQQFREPGNRIAIASTLAAGEGLNLQFCSNAILLERQGNPPKEEQAESRFTRIGSTASQVNITGMLAISTVDDYFTEIVERKRAILKRSHGEPCEDLEEQKLISELLLVLQAKGKSMWSLWAGQKGKKS